MQRCLGESVCACPRGEDPCAEDMLTHEDVCRDLLREACGRSCHVPSKKD